MDRLHGRVSEIAETATGDNSSRADVFREVVAATADVLGNPHRQRLERLAEPTDLTPVPHLSEPWYCCAEPVAAQLTALL
jgi:hypothetical protein